jgi:hypothetical protein
MSYYDDSSLFVAPNGYKTSVLFAQKPMDANGQLAFTRSNDTATRVGPDGLIEKVRTNLILQSNTFSNASWTNNTLVTANNQISPDGTLDASTFTSDGAYHGVLQSLTITSVPHTFSIYAKAGNYSIFRIVNVSSLTNVAWFNLSTGVTSGAIGGTSKIEAVGNGWFRCSYSTNSPNTSTTNQGFVLSDAMGSLGGVPSGSTMYFWKSQIETGDIATDTITTLGTAVSVGPVANVPRLDYLGSSCGRLILEGQRTNLFNFSEQLDNSYWFKGGSGAASAPVVTANYAISPDGYQNADRVYFDAVGTSSADRSSLIRDFAFTTGQTYTISGYAKSATGANQILQFRIAGAQVGGELTATSEWQRFSVTYAATTSTTDNFGIQLRGNNTETTSDLLLYGLQLELASYATSYIPTLGAAVTRGADACSKTGISSLIGQTEGTIFVEVNDFSYNPQAVLFKITGLISVQTRTTNQIRIEGTGYDYFYTPTQKHLKIAAAYTASTIVIYVNGVQVHEDTSVTISGGSNLIFNETGNGTEILNQALLFKTRLSNSELASLTTL